MIRYLISVILVLAVAGCASEQSKKTIFVGGSQGTGTAGSEQTVTLSAKGGKLQFDPKEFDIRSFDINGDKKPDIINVYKRLKNDKGETETRIFVKEMDLNHDGKIDVYRYYDERGAVAKEEFDVDFDGKLDTVDFYRGGRIYKKELCFKFDEKPNIWKYYDEKDNLIKLEEDQDGDGNVDYWEFYSNSVLERVEKDTDKDGRPDIFKRAGDNKFTAIIRNDKTFENDRQIVPEQKVEPEKKAQPEPDKKPDSVKKEENKAGPAVEPTEGEGDSEEAPAEEPAPPVKKK